MLPKNFTHAILETKHMSKTQNVEMTHDIDQWTFKQVALNHRAWIRDNHKTKTLTDLSNYLEGIAEEFDGYDNDALLIDHLDELGDAGDYVRMFGGVVCSDTGEPYTFEYRRGNLECDMSFLETLIEEVGSKYWVKYLVPFADLDSLRE